MGAFNGANLTTDKDKTLYSLHHSAPMLLLFLNVISLEENKFIGKQRFICQPVSFVNESLCMYMCVLYLTTLIT